MRRFAAAVPDPNADRLKAAIGAYYQIEPSRIFVGNGSDEVLAHVFHALFKHGRRILFPDVTYSFYPSYCALYEIGYETVPLDEVFQIHIDDYVQPERARNGGIIFPNPNAPTGIALPLPEIETLARTKTATRSS